MRVVGGTAALRAVVTIAVFSLGASACGDGSQAEEGDGSADRTEKEATSTTRPSSGSPAKPGGGAASGRPSDEASPNGSSQSTTTTVSGAAGSPGAAGGAGGKGSTTTTVDFEKSKTLDLTAALKEQCVRPGGSQTITIRSERQSSVGYDAVYSDGKGGAREGHHGGNDGGQVDDKGTYVDTWTVKPTAPAGRVSVNVLGAKVVKGKPFEHNQITVHFTVSDALGKCG